MSCINKLVIYASDVELAKHAAGYPCLVNYNPFLKSGELDDGCGHYAHVTFAVLNSKADFHIPVLDSELLPAVLFDNVEMIGCTRARE